MSVRLWNVEDGGSQKITFLVKNQHNTKENLKQKIQRGMSVRQKMGIILESKVARKLSLEKKSFTKKQPTKIICLEKI